MLNADKMSSKNVDTVSLSLEGNCVYLTNLLLTAAVSVAVGFVFVKRKVPGGMMIGAILGSMALNIFTDRAVMHYEARYIAQMAAGAFVGLSINKKDMKEMRKLGKPIVVYCFSWMVVTFLGGFLIYFTSPLDLITSLMCCVPAGVSDTPMLAAVMGGDGGKVAVVQFFRLFLSLSIFPTLIWKYDIWLRKKHNEPLDEENLEEVFGGKSAKARLPRSERMKRFGITCAVAYVFGSLGRMSGITSGTLLFAMAATMVLNFWFGGAYIPLTARRAAQAISGAYIGSGMGLDDLLDLRFVLIPAIIVGVMIAINCLITGRILEKKFKLERKEALLSLTPGGLADMALLSTDMGVRGPNLTVLQLSRLLIALGLFPQIITLLAHLIEG